MPDHTRLQALLQDRKSPSKGRASRRMTVCLDDEIAMDRARAQQELDAAKSSLDTASKNADNRAGGKAPVDPELEKALTAAEKALAAAEDAADDASVVIVFTALKSQDYDELVKKYPPREGNEADAANDVNQGEFPDALMRASITKLEDTSGQLVDMDIDDLIGTLSNGERIVACQVANEVNLRITSAPFSDASSRSRQRSGSKSRRR